MTTPGPWYYDDQNVWIMRDVDIGGGEIWCEFNEEQPPPEEHIEWLVEQLNDRWSYEEDTK